MAETRANHSSVGDSHDHGAPATERPPLPAPKLARATGGAKLAYRELAGIGLAIINPLVYGATLEGVEATSGQMGFVEAMSAGHQFIYFDQRGVGGSAGVGVGRTWEARADDLWAVADAAGVERAVLYGVGDGGHTIAHAALRQPDRVLGLIFNRVPLHFAATDHDTSGLQAAAVDGWFRETSATPFGTPNAVMEAVGISGGDRDLLVRTWQATATPELVQSQHDLLLSADLRPLLPRIHVPALIIAPKRRAQAIYWGHAMAALLPGSRLVQPENAGESLGAIHAFLTVLGSGLGRLASRVPAALSNTVANSQRAVESVSRIVVPVGDDVATGRAVEVACRLGQTQRAEIILVHVIPVVDATGASDDAREHGERALRIGEAIVAEHELPSRAHLIMAYSVSGAVVRFAREERANLIVISLGDPHGREATALGRVAREILNNAPCEVLVDRGAPHE